MWEIILDFFKTKTNEKKRKVSNKAVITVNISQNHYWFFNCCCFGICGFYTALASWFWFSLSESRTCVSEHFLISSGGGEFTTFSISSSPFLGKCLIFPFLMGGNHFHSSEGVLLRTEYWSVCHPPPNLYVDVLIPNHWEEIRSWGWSWC